MGTDIYASESGVVTKATNYGWNGGYGIYVTVEHADGSTTLYAHMSDRVVKKGQSVKRGQLLGYVGSTGRSTGNHLHFEVRNASPYIKLVSQ